MRPLIIAGRITPVQRFADQPDRVVIRGQRCSCAEIRDAVPHLSDTMLGQRLRELEAEGIVTREVSTELPLHVHYRLTEKGLALEGAIDAISSWADTWLEAPQAAER